MKPQPSTTLPILMNHVVKPMRRVTLALGVLFLLGATTVSGTVRITGGLDHYTPLDLSQPVGLYQAHLDEQGEPYLIPHSLHFLLQEHLLVGGGFDLTYVELLLAALDTDVSQATFDALRVVTGAASEGTQVYVLVANNGNLFTDTREVSRSGVFSLDIPLAEADNYLLLVFVQDDELSALLAVLHRPSEHLLEDLLQFTPRLPGESPTRQIEPVTRTSRR